MRLIDLNLLNPIELPKSKAELTRGLSEFTLSFGVTRFGYFRLPANFDLLNHGVRPRTVNNFPEQLLKEYLDVSRTPFGILRRAIRSRAPLWISDTLNEEERLFLRLLQGFGYQDGLVVPIDIESNAVMLYAFDTLDRNLWPEKHHNTPLHSICRMVNMAATTDTSLSEDFVIPGLTPRVRQMVKLKARGFTYDEIGRQMGIQPDSAKKSLTRLSKRLGGLHTVELVYQLTRMGMI